MANPNFVINGAYIAGGIMALTSIVVPSLLIPAVIVAAMPLLLTSFISEKKITRWVLNLRMIHVHFPSTS